MKNRTAIRWQEKCAATGKVSHRDFYGAARHMRTLAKHELGGIAALEVYQCGHCRGWHVGHNYKPPPACGDLGEAIEEVF